MKTSPSDQDQPPAAGQAVPRRSVHEIARDIAKRNYSNRKRFAFRNEHHMAFFLADFLRNNAEEITSAANEAKIAALVAALERSVEAMEMAGFDTMGGDTPTVLNSARSTLALAKGGAS